mmetsp:Transcript_29055/g.74626  ORF Transcript_29055/g.74626 Transcript_29055/m.74626 type:complete len:85 (+) Transcript_29055:354-608(+)
MCGNEVDGTDSNLLSVVAHVSTLSRPLSSAHPIRLSHDSGVLDEMLFVARHVRVKIGLSFASLGVLRELEVTGWHLIREGNRGQ